MFNCPKCGADNLLTAIFCRCCGERLELSEIKPEEVAAKPPKTSSERANEIVGIVLLVLIVLTLLGALCPVPGCNGKPEVPDEVNERYEKLAKKYKNDVYVSFTDEEAACIATRAIGSFAGEAGVLKPSAVGVKALSNGSIRLTLTSKLAFLPIHTVVTVTPDIQTQGVMNLTMSSARLGYLPLPAALQPYFLDTFKNVARSTLGNAKDYKFKALGVEENKLTFLVRAH